MDPQVRRRGVATALIEWVARDAERNGPRVTGSRQSADALKGPFLASDVSKVPFSSA
ncbi:GNAT family N-acetyltransferase [Amycolatopsis sp. NEAU-NG30]|uniref:GNAT family N-acetyltransferase n=1 Tax=Amycolatopsis melonis TaxID=3156488 RepID=A0ABV0LN71_9PSEU